MEIQKEIQHKQKILSTEEYKNWLQKKLDEYRIDRGRLVATMMVVERSIGMILRDVGSRRTTDPFYLLFKEDGSRTKAWINAAELVLFLKYHGFKPGQYVEAITTHPLVRKFVFNKAKKNQIPLSVLFPSARKNTHLLKDYSRHVRAYFIKH